MRLFVGVWLSEAMREEVMEYIRLAQRDYPGFKWTNSDNLHFTLKFLGEVSEPQVKSLKQALQSAAGQNGKFQLKLGAAGFFPARGTPRIIWLGTGFGGNELCKLADSVEYYCLQQGFTAADKHFRPHLTIARAKNDFSTVKLPILNREFKSETMVTGFSLIESRLFKTGSVYQTVENYALIS